LRTLTAWLIKLLPAPLALLTIKASQWRHENSILSSGKREKYWLILSCFVCGKEAVFFPGSQNWTATTALE